MNNIVLILMIISIVFGCKETSEKNDLENQVAPIEKELTDAQKIALEHGIENWSAIEQLAFTFNVDRGLSHMERSFVWNVRSGEVLATRDSIAINYNRNEEMDSIAMAADRQFINDTFWLLAPFKPVWDDNTSLTKPVRTKAPISGDEMNSFTINYGNVGGYTPGDAYDFYYDDSFTLREWTYRRGGQEEPSMSTTWEDYTSINGVKLSLTRNDISGTFKIYFSNLSVE